MKNLINLNLANIKGSKKLRKIFKFLKKYFGEKDPGNVNFNFDDKPSRMIIVQKIIDIKKYQSYLEIGTFDNELFSFINCKEKIGIDPFYGGTHRMTSDAFFFKNKKKFDCIFIDGLHHYDQVKKDIKNSLNFLNENGIILVHDCLPKNLLAQSIPRTVVNWNGDVWKAFVEIRTNIELDAYTCYADHGIGVILKRKNRNVLNIECKNFQKLKFIDFYREHNRFMNIVDFNDLIKLL